MKLRVIKNAAQHEEALREIERLVLVAPEDGSDDADRLAVLALLVENYEKEHFPIKGPTPIEAIRFRMDQGNLTQRDLEPYIGSRSKVSEVLNGKVPLSLRMIQALHDGLGIPADVLLSRPEPQQTDGDAAINWVRFPIREMWKRGWFEATATEIRKKPAEVAERFFADCLGDRGAAASVFFRRSIHRRAGATLDHYATLAWCVRVQGQARKMKLARYERGNLAKDSLHELVHLSVHSDGPLRARDYLAAQGVALIIEPHLPKTKLDGAAMQTPEGRPVVGLTLRYDRVDSFWFTLLHELAHLVLHVRGTEQSFVDDLDVSGSDDRLEREADRLARDSAIPRTVWRRSAAYREQTTEAVVALARDLQINPALIAGRLRQETGNYYLFNQLVGHRLVRPLFGHHAEEGE